VAPYSTDPGAVLNRELAAELSPEQLAAVKRNGFVIVRRPAAHIYDAYSYAHSVGAPVFVTTDALLHTYHALHDYTLRQVEYEHLVQDLRSLLGAMASATEIQVQRAAKVAPVREAATRNLAFITVARKLLDPGVAVPSAVRDLVDAELQLIQAHSGFAPSPIFEYEEDYSQYVPRGHYTRNETFGRYFRAMMWLGRIMFRLRPGEQPELVAMGRRETRQALLLVMAVQNAKAGEEGAVAVWERIYEPATFFVGKADDLSIYEYSAAALKTFGGSMDLAVLADDQHVDAFIQAASAERKPKIVSSRVFGGEAAAVTQGFRFMGQRFVPDSYVLQQLVYDKVKGYRGQGKPFTMEPSGAGSIRAFPRGLDLAAVLGSERAVDILTAEGDTDYEGYEDQLAKLHKEFFELPAEQWTENLYWHWLHTLRAMLGPKGEGYPTFMRNQAWVDKALNTFLGSWTELRHDTILYAKQGITVGRGEAPRPEGAEFPGYVEPEVEAWSRLLHLVRQTHTGLKDRGLLSEEFDQKFSTMAELVQMLRGISVKELTNQPLNETEAQKIKHIGSLLEAITTFRLETQEEIASDADKRMGIVADVHTDVNSGRVLEEGIGDPFTIYVVVPGEGNTHLTMGAVFAHYEFKQPMAERLTDEAWQAMTKPPLAPWVGALVVP
jgi:hypothetical protein